MACQGILGFALFVLTLRPLLCIDPPNFERRAIRPVMKGNKNSSRRKPKNGRKRRVEVRPSGVHGRGVYAAAPIQKGRFVLEYKGEIITWRQALKRHPHDPAQPHHTFYFHLDDGHVIDALRSRGWAKWINHSCAPNLEAKQRGYRVFLHAIRDIQPGEELFYDYALIIEGRKTAKDKKDHACLCGSPNCRKTMLA